MQPPAMNADLRILIAGALAARLPVDELTKTIEEAALGVLDAGFEQLLAEPERREFAHAMRQQRDANAEFFQLRRRFIDAAGYPACVQVEREREAANTAADDGYGHD